MPIGIFRTRRSTALSRLVEISHKLLEQTGHRLWISDEVAELTVAGLLVYEQVVRDDPTYFEQEAVETIVAVQLYHAEDSASDRDISDLGQPAVSQVYGMPRVRMHEIAAR